MTTSVAQQYFLDHKKARITGAQVYHGSVRYAQLLFIFYIFSTELYAVLFIDHYILISRKITDIFEEGYLNFRNTNERFFPHCTMHINRIYCNCCEKGKCNPIWKKRNNDHVRIFIQILGYYGGPVRSPLCELTQAQKVAVRSAFEQSGFLTFETPYEETGPTSTYHENLTSQQTGVARKASAN